MEKQLLKLKGKIAALRPVYSATGDGTEIIFTDGRICRDPRGIRSVYRFLARLYAVDIVAARRHYRQVLGQANGIPLPFSAQLIFCPLKMRHPRCRGDFTLGYVSYQQIDEIEEYSREGYSSAVILQNGIRIYSLNKIAFLQKQLVFARLVKNHYLETQGLTAPEEVVNFPTRAEFILLETKLNLLLQNYVMEEEKGILLKKEKYNRY
jgi:hypothetical protein